jgi:hypothetical protein
MVLPNVPAQLGFVAHGVLGALATELGVEAPVPLGLPTVEGLAELLARTQSSGGGDAAGPGMA